MNKAQLVRILRAAYQTYEKHDGFTCEHIRRTGKRHFELFNEDLLIDHVAPGLCGFAGAYRYMAPHKRAQARMTWLAWLLVLAEDGELDYFEGLQGKGSPDLDKVRTDAVFNLICLAERQVDEALSHDDVFCAAIDQLRIGLQTLLHAGNTNVATLRTALGYLDEVDKLRMVVKHHALKASDYLIKARGRVRRE